MTVRNMLKYRRNDYYILIRRNFNEKNQEPLVNEDNGGNSAKSEGGNHFTSREAISHLNSGDNVIAHVERFILPKDEVI